LLGLFGVVAMFATACSIQAPVEVQSRSGGGAVAGDQVAEVPADAGGVTDVAGAQISQPGTNTASAGAKASNVPGQVAQVGSTGKVANTASDVGVTPTEIKVGSLFALSGPVSSISGPILYGVNAYFRDINDKGGINGRKIRMIYYDDGYDAQRGAGLIRRLVEQDKVFVLSVVPSSSSLEAATGYIEQKKIPVIGTSGLVETQFQSPMQFPVGASTVVGTHAGLKFAGDTYHPKSVALIYLDLLAGEFAKKATEGAMPKLGMNSKPCSEQKVPLGQARFDATWANIRNDCGGFPDWVVLAIDPSSAIKAIGDAKTQGFKPNKGWGGGAPLFLDLVRQGVGSYGIGMGASTSYFPPVGKYLQLPAVQNYVTTVKKYSPSGVDVTNPYLEGGFVGAALNVESFRRAGQNPTRAAVLTALNGLENWTIGLTKPLTFKGGNKYANSQLLFAEIRADSAGNLEWQMVSDWIPDPFPGTDIKI
jgi:branched-chain amino acid transport system substrate-binding protein